MAQWQRICLLSRRHSVRSLGWEDPLEKEMATHFHSSIPGRSQGQRSPVSYSPWGHKESDTTKRLNGSSSDKEEKREKSRFWCYYMDLTTVKVLIRFFLIKVGLYLFAGRSAFCNDLISSSPFPVPYIIIWKMMLLKCCTHYASKFGKLSRGLRTGKG